MFLSTQSRRRSCIARRWMSLTCMTPEQPDFPGLFWRSLPRWIRLRVPWKRIRRAIHPADKYIRERDCQQGSANQTLVRSVFGLPRVLHLLEQIYDIVSLFINYFSSLVISFSFYMGLKGNTLIGFLISCQAPSAHPSMSRSLRLITHSNTFSD